MPGIGFDRWVELIFAGAIVAATVVNVYIAHSEWTAMVETNRINTRPYINIELLPDTLRIAPNPSKSGDTRSVLAIDFTVENGGRLPAPLDIGSNGTWLTQHHQPNKLDGFRLVATLLLFPGAKPKPYTAYSASLGESDVRDIRASGEKTAYFKIRATYGPLDQRQLYETELCTTYEIVAEGDVIHAGDAGICDKESSNYTK